MLAYMSGSVPPRRVPTRSAAAGGPSTTIVAIRKLQTVPLHGKSGIARVHVGTRCNPVKAASKGHSPTAGRCSNVVLSSPAKIPWLASFCHRFRPPHRIQDKAAHGCPYLLWYWSSATQHAGGGPAAVGFRCMRVAGKTVCAFWSVLYPKKG